MSDQPIKVLIVDDSDLIRAFLREAFEKAEGIEVIGEAENGREGLRKALSLSPDIITMDINMPVMGGLEAIENIMAQKPTPILVISSEDEAVNTLEAVRRGALEFLPKGSFEGEELVSKIRILSQIKVITHLRGKRRSLKPADSKTSGRHRKFSFKHSSAEASASRPEKIVAVASSTGGPQALSVMLSMIPPNFPFPIVIAQHISMGFASGLVELLKKECSLSIKIGEDNEVLKAGSVYLGTASSHMTIKPNLSISLVGKSPGDIYFPSCNRLLSSAAEAFKENCIGVILTGMGDDGAKGIIDIKSFGGLTIAQDESTSTIFGMPKAAIEKGGVDFVLPIEKIGVELLKIVALKI